MNLTIEDLEKLGIQYIGTKIKPHLFIIPYVGEVTLRPPYQMDTIFQVIYSYGKEYGIDIGKEAKIQEIKDVLGSSRRQ